MPLLCVGIASFLMIRTPRQQMLWIVFIALEWGIAIPWSQVSHITNTQSNPLVAQIDDGPVFSIPRRLNDREIVSPTLFRDQIHHKQPIFASIYFGVTAWDSYAPNALGMANDWQTALKCMRLGGGRWLLVNTLHYPDPNQATLVIEAISKIIKPTAKTILGFI